MLSVKQKYELVQVSTKIWKEADITYLNALPHQPHETLQKKHEYHQSGHATWSRYEPSGSHVPVYTNLLGQEEDTRKITNK
jgi:hypothetical protein